MSDTAPRPSHSSTPYSVNYAQRLRDIEPFRVMAVLGRARELEAQGRDIVHMEVGEPDFSTAEPIITAAQASLGRGETAYCPAAGLPELRQAISQHYHNDYGVTVDPSRILITPGASGALLLVAALLMNPGDGMLMTDPGYPCNRHFLRLVEGEGQLVPVGPAERFQLQANVAESHWRANTVGAMVASPANPSGELLRKEELMALVALCKRKQGHLVVDEIYHGLTYGEEADTVLALTEDAFVINSFSKYFGMTGWRVGWLVAPENAMPELEKLAQNLFISVSTTAQHAALAAFQLRTREILESRREAFAERRDFLLPELRRLGFSIPSAPAGAFYLYAGIEQHAADSEAFCLKLLEEHGLAITPGTDFGQHRALQHVRFAYTTGLDRLQEAVQRLDRLLA